MIPQIDPPLRYGRDSTDEQTTIVDFPVLATQRSGQRTSLGEHTTNIGFDLDGIVKCHEKCEHVAVARSLEYRKLKVPVLERTTKMLLLLKAFERRRLLQA